MTEKNNFEKGNSSLSNHKMKKALLRIHGSIKCMS